MEKSLSSVREMILVEDWEEEEWKANQNEGQILSKLKLKYDMIYRKKEKR